ncbi:MAG: hypothetical protein AABX82_04895 [Nanoarchaeota archaeon]
MVEYKQGGTLVEAVRNGQWSLDDIAGNPYLALVLHDRKKGNPDGFGRHYTLTDTLRDEEPIVPKLIKEMVVPQ